MMEVFVLDRFLRNHLFPVINNVITIENRDLVGSTKSLVSPVIEFYTLSGFNFASL